MDCRVVDYFQPFTKLMRHGIRNAVLSCVIDKEK